MILYINLIPIPKQFSKKKGSGISNDPITSFCKITDLVYHKSDKVQPFASIYPVQSVTIGLNIAKGTTDPRVEFILSK